MLIIVDGFSLVPTVTKWCVHVARTAVLVTSPSANEWCRTNCKIPNYLLSPAATTTTSTTVGVCRPVGWIGRYLGGSKIQIVLRGPCGELKSARSDSESDLNFFGQIEIICRHQIK